MDSLTQFVTGAVLAAAVVPPRHRRAALWAGAALGTLPDLDVLPLVLFSDDPVLRMTAHRSVTHSLLVLPWLSTLIWWWFRRQSGRVAAAPRAWWWAILLALATHPLLDCFNAYGTWLFWPLGEQAIMWGNMFIIDPLFTLPLLLAFGWLAWLPLSPRSGYIARMAVALSGFYLAWSLLAQAWVTHRVDQQLVNMGLQDAPRLVTATPFNTVLWQVLVMTPDGVLSGDYSLIQDDAQTHIAWIPVVGDGRLFDVAAGQAAMRRLRRFNQGFAIARVVDEQLLISDVRMGRYPHYSFNFAVARWRQGQWQTLNPPLQIHGRPDIQQEWAYLQRRLWGERMSD